MRLLDLFCGAGGASAGYHRAGFSEVVGVDVAPQPSYPFEFIQADATAPPVDLDSFDLIHASPPCQAWTAYRRRPGWVRPSPDLIPQVRALLAGRASVIENVEAAPLHGAVTLCGSMFGLDVRRHRSFECSWAVAPLACRHDLQTPRFPPASNRTNLRRTVEVGVWRIPLEVQRRAMGIAWMSRPELSQAIPPAYTEELGRSFLGAGA